MRKPPGPQGGAAVKQLQGNWTEPAGIETKPGMEMRACPGARPHVSSAAFLEQHPQKVLHQGEVVPIGLAVLPAPRT